MTPAGTAVLRTERLELRELREDDHDVDFVASQLAHPEVMRWFPRCYSRAEAVEWVRRQRRRYAEDGCGYWLAVTRAGDPVGQAGVLMLQVRGAREASLGYIIHRPFWRQGYAYEAARACRQWAHRELDRRRVITLIRPENEPSLGVARKLGMCVVGRTQLEGLEHLILSIPAPTP